MKEVKLLDKTYKVALVDDITVDDVGYYSRVENGVISICTKVNGIKLSGTRLKNRLLTVCLEEIASNIGYDQFAEYHNINYPLFEYITNTYIYLIKHNDLKNIQELDSIDLLGNGWAIECLDNFDNVEMTPKAPEGAQGYCFTDKELILIRRSDINEYDNYHNVLWHELTHAILNFLGIVIDDEETLTQMLSFTMRMFTDQNDIIRLNDFMEV